MKVEYRIREVTRYIVTRHEENDEGTSGSSSQKGEYENMDVAYEVGYALCREEHSASGLPLDDERFTYPKHPHDLNGRIAV